MRHWVTSNGLLRLSGALRSVHNNSACSTCSAQLRGVAARCASSNRVSRCDSHVVQRVQRDGGVSKETVSFGTLLRTTKLHSRDLVSLQLGAIDIEYRPLHMILPRKHVIVVGVGFIKMIIAEESALVFNVQNPLVESWLERLCDRLMENSATAPFELTVLEEALHEMCETYAQRARIHRPLVEDLLSGGVVEMLPRLVLLKDALSNFELAISDFEQTLNRLIHNEEDMFNILISRHAAARKSGIPLEGGAHDEVELLLESYHHHLTLTQCDAVSLQRMVQSKQELSSIAIDIQRNRVISMNLSLSIGSVSLAVCTTLAGYLGMNLPIPPALETMPGAFLMAVAGSTAVGASVALGCMFYIRDTWLQKEAQHHMQEMRALQAIFQDMGRMDLALRAACLSEVVTREKFKSLLESAKGGKLATDFEVDLLFKVFDRSRNGIVETCELKFLEAPSRRWRTCNR